MASQMIQKQARAVVQAIEGVSGQKLEVSGQHWDMLCGAVAKLSNSIILSEEQDVLLEAAIGEELMEELYGDLEGWNEVRHVSQLIQNTENRTDEFCRLYS